MGSKNRKLTHPSITLRVLTHTKEMRFGKVVLGSELAQHSLVWLVAERTHVGDAVFRTEMPRIWKDFWGQVGCLQLITPRKTDGSGQ